MKEHLFFYAEWKEGELVTIEFSTVRESVRKPTKEGEIT